MVVLNYAKEHLSDRATDVKDQGFWNGMIVYEPIYEETILLGNPRFILLSPDGSLRLSDDEESFAIFDFLTG